MATTNGDVHIETAASFAKDYLDDLFITDKYLSAFEEETLDLDITSKFDKEASSSVESIPEPAVDHVSALETSRAENVVEAKANHETVAESSVESIAENAVETVVENKENDHAVKEDIPEPGQETLQVNGDVATEKVVAEHNGHLESEVVEPGQQHFSSESTEPAVNIEKVTYTNVHEEQTALEPGQTSFSSTTAAVTEEEVTESEDVVTPIPMSRAKTSKSISEDEELDRIAEDMNFKKIGLSKSWWDSKRTETEDAKEKVPPADKFKTIKQNIRKGQVRELRKRFENMSKVFE